MLQSGAWRLSISRCSPSCRWRGGSTSRHSASADKSHAGNCARSSWGTLGRRRSVSIPRSLSAISNVTRPERPHDNGVSCRRFAAGGRTPHEPPRPRTPPRGRRTHPFNETDIAMIDATQLTRELRTVPPTKWGSLEGGRAEAERLSAQANDLYLRLERLHAERPAAAADDLDAAAAAVRSGASRRRRQRSRRSMPRSRSSSATTTC
jgi:hypothetical protein